MASNNLILKKYHLNKHHTDTNNPNGHWDISLAHVLPYIIEGEEFMNFTAAYHQGANIYNLSTYMPDLSQLVYNIVASLCWPSMKNKISSDPCYPRWCTIMFQTQN